MVAQTDREQGWQVSLSICQQMRKKPNISHQ